MDIEQSWFKTQLSEKVNAYTELTLPQILNSVQLLPKLTKELLIQEIIRNTFFDETEQSKVINELWKGVQLEQPAYLDEADLWLDSVPSELHDPLKQRLAQLKLNKYIDNKYSPHVEPYFLERRADLERVVYGLIRVDSQGIAEEFYLRLLEDENEFCELASEYSLGDEKYTNGLLGPMVITQPPEIIRKVIKKLKVGEVHPPFRADKFFILLKLVHRISPSLDEPTRNRLMQELFEKDILQEVGNKVQETVDRSISARQLEEPMTDQASNFLEPATDSNDEKFTDFKQVDSSSAIAKIAPTVSTQEPSSPIGVAQVQTSNGFHNASVGHVDSKIQVDNQPPSISINNTSSKVQSGEDQQSSLSVSILCSDQDQSQVLDTQLSTEMSMDNSKQPTQHDIINPNVQSHQLDDENYEDKQSQSVG